MSFCQNPHCAHFGKCYLPPSRAVVNTFSQASPGVKQEKKNGHMKANQKMYGWLHVVKKNKLVDNENRKKRTLNVAPFSFAWTNLGNSFNAAVACYLLCTFSGRSSVLFVFFLVFPSYLCTSCVFVQQWWLCAACTGQADTQGKVACLTAHCSAEDHGSLPCPMGWNRAGEHWKHFQTRIIILDF